jgi:hypothetical protein
MFNLIIMETQKQQGATWKTIKTKCDDIIIAIYTRGM